MNDWGLWGWRRLKVSGEWNEVHAVLLLTVIPPQPTTLTPIFAQRLLHHKLCQLCMFSLCTLLPWYVYPSSHRSLTYIDIYLSLVFVNTSFSFIIIHYAQKGIVGISQWWMYCMIRQQRFFVICCGNILIHEYRWRWFNDDSCFVTSVYHHCAISNTYSRHIIL